MLRRHRDGDGNGARWAASRGTASPVPGRAPGAAHRAPFPYFGGKAAIASAVWGRFGSPDRYIEPFAGSLAVLLARPLPFVGREIVNDSDGLLVNAWRALAHDPEAVARWADWPVSELDLAARHAWLVGRRDDITARLAGDPDWHDAKAAGWWLWGISLWIGGGWGAGGRRLPFIGGGERGIHRQMASPLAEMFAPLAERLRGVRITCGDWTRLVKPSVLFHLRLVGHTAVFLDPPYADTAERASGTYAHDDESVAHAVREWTLAHGDDPRLRIALCGYAGEHDMPPTWAELAWTQPSGMSPRRRRERVWFSPHCLRPGLWDGAP